MKDLDAQGTHGASRAPAAVDVIELAPREAISPLQWRPRGGLTLYGSTPSPGAEPPAAPLFTPSIILGPFYPRPPSRTPT